MSFGSYSTTPASNISINGISIAENCPAANLNNALRQLAADGRELYDTVSAISLSSYMPKSGGLFTGPIGISGLGNFMYHVDATHAGPVYFQPVATALPSSPYEGTVVFQY